MSFYMRADVSHTLIPTSGSHQIILAALHEDSRDTLAVSTTEFERVS